MGTAQSITAPGPEGGPFTTGGACAGTPTCTITVNYTPVPGAENYFFYVSTTPGAEGTNCIVVQAGQDADITSGTFATCPALPSYNQTGQIIAQGSTISHGEASQFGADPTVGASSGFLPLSIFGDAFGDSSVLYFGQQEPTNANNCIAGFSFIGYVPGNPPIYGNDLSSVGYGCTIANDGTVTDPSLVFQVSEDSGLYDIEVDQFGNVCFAGMTDPNDCEEGDLFVDKGVGAVEKYGYVDDSLSGYVGNCMEIGAGGRYSQTGFPCGSGSGVTSVFGQTGAVPNLSGDVTTSGSSVATVKGINGVPLCTGFTPTTGQNLQYTTASTPNPCYTSATGSGGSGTVSPGTAGEPAIYTGATAVSSVPNTYVCTENAPGADDSLKLQYCIQQAHGINANTAIIDARGLTGLTGTVDPDNASSMSNSGIILMPGTFVTNVTWVLRANWGLRCAIPNSSNGTNSAIDAYPLAKGCVLQASSSFQPTYSTGTVTVTGTGSLKTVAGSGTTWTSAMLGCAFVAPAGGLSLNSNWGIIEAVGSATSLTLGYGANGSPYGGGDSSAGSTTTSTVLW